MNALSAPSIHGRSASTQQKQYSLCARFPPKDCRCRYSLSSTFKFSAFESSALVGEDSEGDDSAEDDVDSLDGDDSAGADSKINVCVEGDDSQLMLRLGHSGCVLSVRQRAASFRSGYLAAPGPNRQTVAIFSGLQ